MMELERVLLVDVVHAFASARRKPMMMMKESAISYSHASDDLALVLVLLVPLPVVRDHELWSVEKIVCAAVSDLSPILLLL